MRWILFCLTCVALSACSSDDDATLRGVDWIVDYYEVNGDRTTTNSNYILSLNENEFTFKLNANTCFGTFSNGDDGDISFSSPSCTQACCDDEQALKSMELIREANEYTLNNIELTLTGPNGKVLLFAN